MRDTNKDRDARLFKMKYMNDVLFLIGLTIFIFLLMSIKG